MLAEPNSGNWMRESGGEPILSIVPKFLCKEARNLDSTFEMFSSVCDKASSFGGDFEN